MEIDTSRPHIGRIYDFMLGGHHNYEADRQAAAQILKILPQYPKWARLNRWFLQLMASQWAEQGIGHVLDLATGLPTEGHFNDFLPDARILFSDNDPLSVAYGEELLKNKPNMKYCNAGVGEPETVIKQAAQFFGDQRKLAIGCIGIAYLVPDEILQKLLQALHAYCAPGTVMAMTFLSPLDGVPMGGENVAQAARIAGVHAYFRSNERLRELVAPWKVVRAEPLQDWLEVPDMITQEDLVGVGGYMTGAYCER